RSRVMRFISAPPPADVVSRDRIDHVRFNLLIHDHQMPSRARASEDHGATRGSADIRVLRILQHLLNLLLGDAMFGAVLHIAVRVVIQVPEDCVNHHGPSLASLWNYNTMDVGRRSNRSARFPPRGLQPGWCSPDRHRDTAAIQEGPKRTIDGSRRRSWGRA